MWHKLDTDKQTSYCTCTNNFGTLDGNKTLIFTPPPPKKKHKKQKKTTSDYSCDEVVTGSFKL